jgi:hypothetical protein
MPRQIFTAEDIRRLAAEKSAVLVVGPTDIITHEALDVAVPGRGAGPWRNRARHWKEVRRYRIRLRAGRQAQGPARLSRANPPGANVRLKDIILRGPFTPHGGLYVA